MLFFFFFFKGKLKLLKKEVGVRSLEKFSEHRFRIQDLVKNINNLNMKEEMDGMSLEVALERELLFIFGFCAYLNYLSCAGHIGNYRTSNGACE